MTKKESLAWDILQSYDDHGSEEHLISDADRSSWPPSYSYGDYSSNKRNGEKKRYDKNINSSETVKSETFTSVLLFLVFLWVYAIIVYFCTYFAGSSVDQLLFTPYSQTNYDTPTILIYNEYTQNASVVYYPYDYVLEPYRLTHLSVDNPSTYHTYTWYHSDNGLTVEIDSGATIQAIFPCNAGSKSVISIEVKESATGNTVESIDLEVGSHLTHDNQFHS